MEHEDIWLGLATVGAGISFVVSYVTYQDYLKHKRKHSIINKSQIMSVDQAIKVHSKDNTLTRQNAPYMIVIGSAKRIGASVLDALYQETKHYSIFAAQKHHNFQGRAVQATSFHLTDINSKKKKILVHPTHNTLSFQLLHKVPSKKEPWYKAVLKFVAIFALTNIDLTEPVITQLKEEDVISICGFLEYNKHSGELFFESPDFFFSGGKTQIMSYLAQKKSQELIQTILFLVPGVLCSYFLISNIRSKISKWYRAYKERKMQREIQQRLEGINFEGYECIICMERGRNIICLPCKHFSLCDICIGDLQKQECPICKEEIVETVKLYLS